MSMLKWMVGASLFMLLPSCDTPQKEDEDGGVDTDSDTTLEQGPCEVVYNDLLTAVEPDYLETNYYNQNGLLEEKDYYGYYNDAYRYYYYSYGENDELLVREFHNYDQTVGYIYYTYYDNMLLKEIHADGADSATEEYYYEYYYSQDGSIDYWEYWAASYTEDDHIIDEYFYDSDGTLVERKGHWAGTPDVTRYRIAFEYNVSGLLIKETSYDEDDSVSSFKRYEYNEDGLIVTKSVGSGGNAATGIASSYWTYTYDEEDRLSTVELYQCADDNCETGEATLRQRDTYSYDCWE